MSTQKNKTEDLVEKLATEKAANEDKERAAIFTPLQKVLASL